METKASIVPEYYRIKPSSIDTSKQFMGAFGKLGREVFAGALVMYCQHVGYWVSFNESTIQDVCNQAGANIAFLPWFLESGLIVKDRHERLCLTEEFVERCHSASPKK